MEKKTLITSYDEINDTFVGKIDGTNGYCADFGIAEGIFLAIDEDRIPSSIYVNNASDSFNISKQMLECPDVRIIIDCDGFFLNFHIFIENLKIYSLRCENRYGIPELNYSLGSNY